MNYPVVFETDDVDYFRSILEKRLDDPPFHIETLTHQAILYGSEKIIHFMIDTGFMRLDGSDEAGYLPIHNAVFAFNYDTSGRSLDILLGYGALIDAVDDAGNSALHISASIRDQVATKALLARGANPFVRNADGKLPVDLAISGCRTLLERAMLSGEPTVPPGGGKRAP